MHFDLADLPKLDPGKPVMQIHCTETQVPIQEIFPDGKVKLLRSMGQCANCNNFFSKEALNINKYQVDPYPVEYVGAYCKQCANSL